MNKFFQEDNGNFSLVRLMSFMTLTVTLFLVVVSSLVPSVKIPNETISVLLTFSFVPKVGQKFAETKKGVE